MKHGLLCNTYRGDFPWFEIMAKSYAKNTSGWSWFKAVIPNADKPLFQPVCDRYGIHIGGFDEWPGKGFNHHQAMQCCGDLHLPEADTITHIDADCVFATPSTPADWMRDGKPLVPFMDFRHMLTRPIDPDEMMTFMGFTGRTIDFSRGQLLWKFAAEFALGFEVPRSTMTWMPITHIPQTYVKVREILTNRFKKSWEDYIRECRNEWPQSFCEFETLGGVAYKCFEDLYSWRNIQEVGYPFRDKVLQCWSHGGFDLPHEFAVEHGGLQTPRQLFQRLGLL